MPERKRLSGGSALVFVERILRGGGHNVFFELLEQAADNAVHAAELLDSLLISFPDAADEAEQITACEHRGDDIVHEMIGRLNREHVTPIDDKDLLKLISALDDVVDLVEEVAVFLRLYRVEAPMVQSQALAQVLVKATRELAQAVRLADRFEDISAHVVEVNRLENEGDTIVRGAIAALFEDRIDPMTVIRWKDIFERIEEAIDSTERAAYVLESVVIQNA